MFWLYPLELWMIPKKYDCIPQNYNCITKLQKHTEKTTQNHNGKFKAKGSLWWNMEAHQAHHSTQRGTPQHTGTPHSKERAPNTRDYISTQRETPQHTRTHKEHLRNTHYHTFCLTVVARGRPLTHHHSFPVFDINKILFLFSNTYFPSLFIINLIYTNF